MVMKFANHQKHLRYFDVGCVSSGIANSTLSSYVQIIKNTCDISTLVVFHPESPIQHSHHTSKAIKTLAIFRRWLCFIRNRQFNMVMKFANRQKHLRYFDVGCFSSGIANSTLSSYVQSNQNTCDISTLVVFHPESPIQHGHEVRKSSKTLAIFRRWLFFIRNRQFNMVIKLANHQKHLRYFDVGCFSSGIANSTLSSYIQIIKNTCDISTLVVFHPESPIQHSHHTSKSSKTLAIFRRGLFFIRNRQFNTLIIRPNHQKHLRYFDVGCFSSGIANSTLSSYVQIIKNTCDISTLVVFHPESTIQHSHHTSKSSKTLAIFRRWLCFIRNRQFNTLIIRPNHQKHLRYFDVGCFSSGIANSTLSSYVQIIKNTCDISTLVVFHPESPILHSHHTSKSSKTLAIFRRWLCFIRNRQFNTLIIRPNHQKHLRYFDVGCFSSGIANSTLSSYVQIIKNTCDISTWVVFHPESPIQHSHHTSKSSKTLAIFRRWLCFIRNRQFNTLIIRPNHQKHLRYFDVGFVSSGIANSTLSSYVQIIKNTCDISTLVVFHPESPIQHSHHTSKAIKTLAIFRRWLFFIRNRQFNMVMKFANRQKHLRYFDVCCFSSGIANSTLSSYVQSNQNTCDISTLVVFHPESPIQHGHEVRKSSKTLAIFRRVLFFIRNRQFNTLIIRPKQSKHLRYFDVGCFSSGIANSAWS